MKRVRVGSRESKLAIAQSEIVINRIQKKHPEIVVELVTMKTTGDKILDRSLDQIGGKGLFVKELDRALLTGEIDLAVHSLKDMPMETDERIPILACSKREDPRDALVLKRGETKLDLSKPVGCSSLRRRLQMETLYPGVQFQLIRGNILTRLQKLDEDVYGGIILAAAGLNRLKMSDRIYRYFTADEMIPSAGQGVLAIQGRAGEDYSYLDSVADPESMLRAICERAFVRRLDGGCSMPTAAYAVKQDHAILLRGLYYREETGQYIIGNKKGSINDAENLGIQLAEKLVHQAAAGIRGFK